MKWLQRILGIQDIYNQVVEQNRYITGLRGELGAVRSSINSFNDTIAVPLANLTAIMLTEDNEARKISSRMLEGRTLRSMADELARAHSEGKI